MNFQTEIQGLLNKPFLEWARTSTFWAPHRRLQKTRALAPQRMQPRNRDLFRTLSKPEGLPRKSVNHSVFRGCGPRAERVCSGL